MTAFRHCLLKVSEIMICQLHTSVGKKMKTIVILDVMLKAWMISKKGQMFFQSSISFI